MKQLLSQNNYAIITGAAGLLGYFHAEALAERKVNLILIDLNKKNLEKISKILKKKYKKLNIIYKVVDITNESKIQKFFTELKIRKIKFKYLINNAEKNPKMMNLKSKKNNSLENYSSKDLRKDIDVGIIGTFNCCKYFGKNISSGQSGIIVNISSDLGINAPDQRVYDKKKNIRNVRNFKPISYSISKHAINGITKYIATFWAHKNIRCNTLSLGAVLNNQPSFLIKNQKDKIPLNRWAKKNEYKSAIQFLTDEKNSYMTGQNLIIDGGRTIW